MTNSPYYRSANKTIQISRSPKHIQVGQPDKNNQYLFTKFSANFHAWQDFFPVTTEKKFIWPTSLSVVDKTWKKIFQANIIH